MRSRQSLKDNVWRFMERHDQSDHDYNAAHNTAEQDNFARPRQNSPCKFLRFGIRRWIVIVRRTLHIISVLDTHKYCTTFCQTRLLVMDPNCRLKTPLSRGIYEGKPLTTSACVRVITKAAARRAGALFVRSNPLVVSDS